MFTGQEHAGAPRRAAGLSTAHHIVRGFDGGVASATLLQRASGRMARPTGSVREHALPATSAPAVSAAPQTALARRTRARHELAPAWRRARAITGCETRPAGVEVSGQPHRWSHQQDVHPLVIAARPAFSRRSRVTPRPVNAPVTLAGPVTLVASGGAPTPATPRAHYGPPVPEREQAAAVVRAGGDPREPLAMLGGLPISGVRWPIEGPRVAAGPACGERVVRYRYDPPRDGCCGLCSPGQLSSGAQPDAGRRRTRGARSTRVAALILEPAT